MELKLLHKSENMYEIFSDRIISLGFSIKQQADVEKLLEKLEDDDDVQNVYHSMDLS